MKKIYSLVLLFVFIFTLSGCKNEDTEEKLLQPILDKAVEDFEMNQLLSTDITNFTINEEYIIEDNTIQITWESQDENVIKQDGTILRYDVDKTIVVTLQFTLSDLSVSKDFTVTVSKLDNIAVMSQLFIDDNLESEFNLFGEVRGIIPSGYYIYSQGYTIFVQSDTTEIELGQYVSIQGVYKQEGNQPYFQEISVEIYDTMLNQPEEVPYKDLSNYTNLYTDSIYNYGTLINSSGIVLIENDNIYITSVTGENRILVSKNVSSFVQSELLQRNGEKVLFNGILETTIDGVWTVIISYVEDFEFVDLSIGEKQAQIINYVDTLYPRVLPKDLASIVLPTTHPIHGGEIVWDVSKTDGLINDLGEISRNEEDTFVTLKYTIKLDPLTDYVGEIEVIVIGIVPIYTIGQLYSDDFYQLAMCDAEEVPGTDCVNGFGIFTVTEKHFSVTGYVLYHLESEQTLVLYDETTNSLIPYKIGETSIANIDVGDTITISGTTYGTVGFRPYLINGEVTEIIKGDSPLITPNFTTLTYDEFINLDPFSPNTYRYFYEVQKSYVFNLNTTVQSSIGYYTNKTPVGDYFVLNPGAAYLLDVSVDARNLIKQAVWNPGNIYFDFKGFIDTSTIINGERYYNLFVTEVPNNSELTNQDKIDLITNATKEAVERSSVGIAIYNYNAVTADGPDSRFSNVFMDTYAHVLEIKAYDSGVEVFDFYGTLFVDLTFETDFTKTNYLKSANLFDTLEITYVLTDSTGTPLEGDVTFTITINK